MTKKLMMMFAAAVVAFGAWAETETVGGYTWMYRINGDTAEIYGTGYPLYTPCVSPKPKDAVTIPPTLGGKPVTSIGERAFYNCSGLTNVTIPDSVTRIGSYAFYNCTGLESVTIPNGVTSIGSFAFSGCGASLYDTTTIPNVKIVDGWAVGNTGSISGDLNLTGIRGIGYQAFAGCRGLKSVTIGNGVKIIGYQALLGCTGLASVTIPDSVTSIENSAFYCCSGLTSVTIPNSVTNIGFEAFYGCRGLTNVTMPSSVTSLDPSAFDGCEKLGAAWHGALTNSLAALGGSSGGM